MIDQNSQFFAILTAVGEAKQANADALGVPWTIAQMGVGDANGTDPIPSRTQTALINERRRAPLNQLKVDPANPGIIIAEQVIPENIGGWWIREIGLYDAAGDLVAVANCAPSFKPQLSQGSGRTQVVRMNLIVTSTANVELKIDPSVVLATRAYCDSKVAEELAKLDHKQSVRYATTGAIALAGLAVQAGGDWAAPLAAGDRVLVKNQADGKDNCFYTAAVGAWVRATDADISAEVTSGLIVAVEFGTTLADTRWQLVTDGIIVLGTTALIFQNITKGFAPLSSPAFTDNPTAPTPAQLDNDTSLATTEFVKRSGLTFAGIESINASRMMTAADAGKIFVIGAAAQVTLPLASSLPQGTTLTFFYYTAALVPTFVRSGTDNFAGGGAYQTSYTPKSTGYITFINETNSIWEMTGCGALDQLSGFGASLTGNGYQKLPSGLIIQWGVIPSISPGGYVDVTYSVTFPNAILASSAIGGSSGAVNAVTWGGAGNPNSSCRFFNNQSGTVATGTGSYIAFGY